MKGEDFFCHQLLYGIVITNFQIVHQQASPLVVLTLYIKIEPKIKINLIKSKSL